MRTPLLALTIAAAVFALAASSASATVVSRFTDVESASNPYGFDQIDASCTGASTTQDALAYTGTHSLKTHVPAACGGFARGLWSATGTNRFASGDDFWVGAAIYLPTGFWAAHSDYTDFIRLDDYWDDSTNTQTPDARRQFIGLAAFSNDSIYMRAQDIDGTINDVVGPLPSSVLAEGRWNWVEMHIKLSPTNGSAINVLKINGVIQGSSTLANTFSGNDPYNRARFGVVSVGGSNSGVLDAYVDRANIGTSELGPAPTGGFANKLAGLESPTTSPYDFDQVSVPGGCALDTAARDTTRAYAGSASLKVHVEGACDGYARGVFNENGTNHFASGDDVWVGTALYLPTGFWAAHTGYTDFMRLDSYVDDSGNTNPDSARQYVTLASFGDDSIWLRSSAVGSTTNDLVGPLPTSALPEGQWNWVEAHLKLSPTNGSAVSELKINGVSKGSSTLANLFSGRAALNRVRYGIVSEAGSAGSGNLTAWVDRARVGRTELGP